MLYSRGGSDKITEKLWQMMRNKILFLTFLLIACLGALWFVLHRGERSEFDPRRNALPPDAQKILDSGGRFVLLSLNPTPANISTNTAGSAGETFHGYPVLGKTEIKDAKQRKELLRALYRGIADSDGSVAGCFNPRHGISATLENKTVELVICFECLSMTVYADGQSGVLTTRSPLPTFNKALEEARLPVATVIGEVPADPPPAQ